MYSNSYTYIIKKKTFTYYYYKRHLQIIISYSFRANNNKEIRQIYLNSKRPKYGKLDINQLKFTCEYHFQICVKNELCIHLISSLKFVKLHANGIFK